MIPGVSQGARGAEGSEGRGGAWDASQELGVTEGLARECRVDGDGHIGRYVSWGRLQAGYQRASEPGGQ